MRIGTGGDDSVPRPAESSKSASSATGPSRLGILGAFPRTSENQLAMRVTSTLLASAFLVCGVHAQSYTAYPIDDLHGVYGHWAPLGILATATNQADECRVHYLIPAAFLASGASVI